MLKFGVSFWQDDNLERISAYAKLAERYHFDTAWFPDHYTLRDTFIVQAMAAERTRRVKLGCGVTTPYLRHPASIASSVLTVHELSKGRAILGLGGGGRETTIDLQAAEQRFRPRTACLDAIRIISGLITGSLVTYNGEVFKTRNAKIPFGLPLRVPIYLAARGPKMLKMAGELCDGVITHGLSRRYLEYATKAVLNGPKADYRRFELCVATYLAISRDVKSAREKLRFGAAIMAGGDYPSEILKYYGLTLDEVRPLRDAIHNGDITKAASLVSEEMLDQFCLTGTAAECIDRIQRLGEMGVTQLILYAPRDSAKARFVVKVGKRILPYFRSNEKR